MARGKKNQLVRTVRYAGGRVEVYFDPNPDCLTFHAQVGDKRFTNVSADALVSEVLRYIRDNLRMVWHPAIVVAEVAPFSPGKASFVGIDVKRVYLANPLDGGCPRQLEWDDYAPSEDRLGGPQPGENMDAYRLSHSREVWAGLKVPDDLPYETKSSDRKTRVLPYTEELYAGLVEIDRGIARLKARLGSLMGDSAGWQQVAAIGAQLLKMLPETTSTTDEHEA